METIWEVVGSFCQIACCVNRRQLAPTGANFTRPRRMHRMFHLSNNSLTAFPFFQMGSFGKSWEIIASLRASLGRRESALYHFRRAALLSRRKRSARGGRCDGAREMGKLIFISRIFCRRRAALLSRRKRSARLTFDGRCAVGAGAALALCPGVGCVNRCCRGGLLDPCRPGRRGGCLRLCRGWRRLRWPGRVPPVERRGGIGARLCRGRSRSR